MSAAQDADYDFKGWSDGNDSPTRKEEHVQADVAVTALFGEVKPLPGSCNFENGSLGDWYTLGAGVAKKGFTVTNTPQVKGATSVQTGRTGEKFTQCGSIQRAECCSTQPQPIQLYANANQCPRGARCKGAKCARADRANPHPQRRDNGYDSHS